MGTPGRPPVIHLDCIEAAIFDVDGVITETQVTHARAWKETFDGYLRRRAEETGDPFEEFTIDGDYARYVDGKPRYDGVRSFLESRGIDLPAGDPADDPDAETICGIGNRKNVSFLEVLRRDGTKRFDSTVDLIHELRRRGIRCAAISASKNAEEVLTTAGVVDLFDTRVDGVVSAELSLPGKPDPEIFLEAARRLGVAPERAVMFEDALSGVEAGRRGDFGLVVGVDRIGGRHGQDLLDRGADIVVRDLGELTIEGASA